jgi:hypothetical protein
MAQKVIIYSEKDIRRFVKEEVGKKFTAFEVLLNSLKMRIIDMERIIEYKIK